MYINNIIFKNGESATIQSEEPLTVGEKNRLLTMYDINREQFVEFETAQIKAINPIPILSSKDLLKGEKNHGKIENRLQHK